MSLKSILMNRDGMSSKEANQRIEEVKELFYGYVQKGSLDEAYYILQEELGVEPDYLMELI